MKRIKSVITSLSLCLLTAISLSSCTKELDVQQSYDYTLDIMPVQNTISMGESAEIRCELITTGNYDNAQFTIRYFQVEGKGELRLDDSAPLKPNDRYVLEDNIFRLYYTSLSEESHHIDVYVEDNFGQVEKFSFEFTDESVEEEYKIINRIKYLSY